MADDVQRGTVGTVRRDSLPGLARFALDSSKNPPPEMRAIQSKTAASLFLKLLGQDTEAACVIIEKEKEKVPAKTLMQAAVKAIAGFGSVEVCLVMPSKSSVNENPSPDEFETGFTAIHCTPSGRRVFFDNDSAPEGFVFELRQPEILLPILDSVFEFAMPVYAGRQAMRAWGNPGQGMSLERKTCN